MYFTQLPAQSDLAMQRNDNNEIEDQHRNCFNIPWPLCGNVHFAKLLLFLLGFFFFFPNTQSFYWCACLPESHCLFLFSCLGVLTQCHNEEEAQKQSRLPPKGQAEMLSALLLLILQCWMTMQNTSYGHPIPDFVVVKWILGRQTSWYTAGLFRILLIIPIPCFQTHTVVAFRSKR